MTVGAERPMIFRTRPIIVEAMAYETCHAGGRTGRVGGFVSLGEKDVRRILELAL